MSSYERFDDGTSREVQLEISGEDGQITFSQDFILDPAAAQGALGPLRLKVSRFINHIFFRLFTVLLIFLDMAIVIVDLTRGDCDSETSRLEIVSNVIISYFVVEVCLRIFCVGVKPFFSNCVDVLDFIVVIISFIISMVFAWIHTESDCSAEEYARLLVIGRVIRIVRIIRITYIMIQQRRHVQTATRQLVSQNKRRYQRDGFDLDLCYITERVIAMSFPSTGLMATYRNPVEEVARFFNTKHKDHYKIYNLCSERSYNEALFFHNVRRIYIDDHNVPKVQEMLDFTKELREWMAADDKNIVAVHCKGGKGRTGTIICIWLIDCGIFEEAADSLEYFGDRRTDLSKGSTFQGVETPSQSRYVGYYEKCVRLYDRQLPPKKVLRLKSLKIHGINSVGHGDGSDFCMEILQNGNVIFHCNLKTQTNVRVQKHPDEDYIQLDFSTVPDLEGDVKTMFKTGKSKTIPIGYDKCPFYFWYNTRFVEDCRLYLPREELDNPHKPKTHHCFKENFAVELLFEDVTSGPESSKKTDKTQ